MNNQNDFSKTLKVCFWRYVVHFFMKNMCDIVVVMGMISLLAFSGIFALDYFRLAQTMPLEFVAIYFVLMIMVTAIVYSLWQLVFHRPTMREVVKVIDREAGLQEQLLYSYHSVSTNDMALQYITQNVFAQKEQWQQYPHTTITKNFVKQVCVLTMWCVVLWILFMPFNSSFLQKPVKLSAKQQKQKQQKQKQQKQKQQKQKQQKQKQQKQKQQKQKQQKQKQQKQKQQKQKQQKQKQQKQKQPRNSKKNKNKQPQGGKGKGNKKNAKKPQKLPKAKPVKEQISSLFSKGNDIDFQANVGTSNKGDSSNLETFHRNLQQLPLYFQKQFLSPEDKMAIKRYFNMIRPSRNQTNN